MSEKIKKNLNIIAIVIIGLLITGQDIYIFSLIGPVFDLLKGPEGIKEAQQFSNLRTLLTTMTTHGLLIAIISLMLMQQSRPVIITRDDTTE